MEMLGLLLWFASGAGLLANIALHINSYLMLFGPAQELAILLAIAIFIIAPLLMGLLRRDIGSSWIGKTLERFPRWALIIWVLGWVYIFLNFGVILAFLDPDEPFVMVRLISGHSMGFYSLFFMLSYQLMLGDFPYEAQ